MKKASQMKEAWFKMNNNISLVVYDECGPTETTVGAFISKIYPNNQNSINIGKPYYGYYAYVLDEELNLLSQGEIGQLYISGVGLAR